MQFVSGKHVNAINSRKQAPKAPGSGQEDEEQVETLTCDNQRFLVLAAEVSADDVTFDSPSLLAVDVNMPLQKRPPSM